MIHKHLFFVISYLLLFSYANSQTITKLHDFDNSDGAFARGNQLISDGTYFYGMTTFGGDYNRGVIYKIKIDGSEFEKLHDFNGENGAESYSSLTLLGTQLFGTTMEGGSIERGVLFRINTDGTDYTKLIDFTATNGDLPHSSLIFDGSFLYGSTYTGGTGSGGGTIFKVRPDGTDFAIIHNFNGSNTIDGSQPNLDLMLDGDSGYMYGVTFLGGLYNKGIIYKIKTDGTGFEKLHDFDGINGDYSSSLMLFNDYLYATTFRGGANEKGIIYKMKKDGTDFIKLHDFELNTGAESIARLDFKNDFLYGTAIHGGTNSGGVIFRIKPDGTEYSNVYAFNGDSGYSPWGGMYFDGEDFYGINEVGGINGYGTIYKFDPDGIMSASEILYQEELNIFPNPAKDKLNVQLKKPLNGEIVIYDLSGMIVMKKEIKTSSNTEFNISQLNKGIYLVKIGSLSVKFIKE